MRYSDKAREALRMPPVKLLGEVAWRGARKGIGLYAGARAAAGHSAPRSSGPPLTDVPVVESNAAAHVSEAAVERAVEEAGNALHGRFRILGFGFLDFGRPVRWSLDPVAGHEWPDVPHRQLPAGGARAGADVKIPWEASRFHWLTALARAHAYTDDPRYLDGARGLVAEWRGANPVGRGVAWSNAMEAGIRAANLVWASQMFADPALDRALSPMLVEHGRYITENLEYSPRLTSNHFLADVVGLVHIGAALRSTRRGRMWLRMSWRALQREILKQFHPDGFNFEGSTCYHRLSTELALAGLTVGDAIGLPIRGAVRDRFAAALGAAIAVTKPDGHIAAIGDDDSGLVLNLASGRSPRDAAPLMPRPGLFDPRTPESDAAHEFRAWSTGKLDLPGTAIPDHLRDAGICVLSNDRFWCLVDAGGVGQNGNGGHAHNDTLSFVLVVDGDEIVTDPGTGTYTANPGTRNRYRSTAAHATIGVDDEEINRYSPDRLFQMNEDARPVVEGFARLDDTTVAVTSHGGYRRLANPVEHRRRFELDERGLTIRDELSCSGPHRARLSLPLAPGVTAERADDAWTLTSTAARLSWEVLEGPVPSVSLEKARVSPAYGAEEPAAVLRGELDFTGPVTLVHRFSLQESAR